MERWIEMITTWICSTVIRRKTRIRRWKKLLKLMAQLTESQINLIYDHFGAGKQLKEICNEENAANGTNKKLLLSVYRYLPVTLCALALISSGVPAATIRPPLSPPPGPMSMT